MKPACSPAFLSLSGQQDRFPGLDDSVVSFLEVVMEARKRGKFDI
jgi:hypothetical protein